MADDDRQITVAWQDPAGLARGVAGQSGLDALRAIRDGELPPAPIQALLGFDLVEVDPGPPARIVFTATPGEQHFNPIGVVHGGLALTMLDSAMGAAVHSTLPVGAGYTTLETKVNLVRGITLKTGALRGEGTVVHRGGRVATAESRLTRASDGALLAHGTSTCLIISAPG